MQNRQRPYHRPYRKVYKPRKRRVKKYLKKLGLFARNCHEFTKYKSLSKKETRRTQKVLKLRIFYKQKFKRLLIFNYLDAMQWHLGEKLKKQNQNLTVINNYLFLIRNETAVYNPHELLQNLRILLNLLTQRMLYKKRCLINYAPNKPRNPYIFGGKPLEKYGKRYFLVTWEKWMGGVLTNFKRIAKRIMAQKRKKIYTKKYLVTYPDRRPQLPHFVISTADSHWTLNESRRIRVSTCQLITSRHLGTFGDITLAMNTTYYALRRFTALLEECAWSLNQRARLYHKNKHLRRFKRLGKIFAKQFTSSSGVQKEKLVSKMFKNLGIKQVIKVNLDLEFKLEKKAASALNSRTT